MEIWQLVSIAFALLAAHYFGDFVFQTEYMAIHKSPFLKSTTPFIHPLVAHVVVNGTLVWLATGSILLGLFEVVAHCIIDILKCGNAIDYNLDQLLHLWCKIIFFLSLYAQINTGYTHVPFYARLIQ